MTRSPGFQLRSVTALRRQFPALAWMKRAEARSAGGDRRRGRQSRRGWLLCIRAAASAAARLSARSRGRQPQFAVRAFGAQAMGQFEFLAGSAGERHRAQRLGCGKIGRGAQLRRGVAKQPALQGRRKRGQPRDINARASRAASPAARPPPRTGRPGRRICGASRAELRLPPGLFIARQLGHLRQMLAQTRVPALKKRQQLVADAVARKSEVAIGRVFAPALAEGVEIGLDFGARGREQRAQDAAFGKFKDRSESRTDLRSMRRAGIWPARFRPGRRGCAPWRRRPRRLGHRVAEPCVAQAARGLFNGFGRLAGRRIGLRLRGNIDAGLMKGQAEAGRELAGKGEIARRPRRRAGRGADGRRGGPGRVPRCDRRGRAAGLRNPRRRRGQRPGAGRA